VHVITEKALMLACCWFCDPSTELIGFVYMVTRFSCVKWSSETWD